ncbi:Ig-like domain-containing protein [Nocardioides sp. C4-1]|uniref:Ig-like domain-containing protein n=1 Tax=Nocardioides sp. C4-1 TaxID=3151851 RepID=UPI003264C109
MRIHRVRAALLGATVLPLLLGTAATATAQAAPEPASPSAVLAEPAAAGEWQDGKHDEDQVLDPYTESWSTGVSANAGWRGNGDRVPVVGETFYVRGYAGLVSLPYSGKVAVLPEFIIPSGTEFADDAAHPVRWSLTEPDRQPVLRTDELTYDRGRNGGVLVGDPDGQPWTLRQGWVLEIQVPVKAVRPLKGPATQQPECEDRREGRAPCPVAQSGDHLQVAFTVGGHGGTKSYVTPYVALFAQAGGSGGNGGNSGNGGNPGNPGTPATKVASTTTAAFKVSRKAKGRAVVTVRSARPAAGRVVVTDRGRAIGTGTVRAGRSTVVLPRLGRGKHVLVVRYAGSATVKPSATRPRTVTIR